MAVQLTPAAEIASRERVLKPQLVLEIEGISTVFGAVPIIKKIYIGDPDLYIGPDWVIGGFNEVGDQSDYLTFEGSSTQITQQLNPDTGIGSSVSSLQIALIDKNDEIARLVSPGFEVPDVLARRCKLYTGFQETAFPDDFIVVFRGVIDEVRAEAGKIVFNISHPDAKKRQKIFNKIETTLDGAINSSQTSITLTSTANFLQRVLGPDGTYDSSFKSYIRVDDEIIEYTSITGNTLNGCVRAQLNTVNVSHSDDANVTTFYRLQGNAMDLARKIMLSSWQGDCFSSIAIKNFVRISGSETIDNSIFFENVNVKQKYNFSIGDYISTTGATAGANNVSLKQISGIETTEFGSYITVDDVSFVEENSTSATISIRSRWDTLPDGFKMYVDEVDQDEHERLYRIFLSSFSYDFYIKDSIDGKEFIEKEIYLPAACYSLPRKSQASVGYHIGPIPGANIKTISIDNVKRPEKLAVRRTTGKNFYNTVIYKFEEDSLEERFFRGTLTTDGTSRNQIPIGLKPLTIISKGMRESLQGVTQANIATNRRLNRYKFAAEFLENVEIFFKDGFNLEVGDVVVLDATDLQLINTKEGTRGFGPRYYEVQNRVYDIKAGTVKVNLVDTGFSTASRYCLIGPASYIKTGISQTQFIIEESFASIFLANEFKKWNRFDLPAVKVRSPDFTTRFFETYIINVTGNQITVNDPLGFTPVDGVDIMEFANYDFAATTDEVKLVYGFMSDVTFGDGGAQYRML